MPRTPGHRLRCALAALVAFIAIAGQLVAVPSASAEQGGATIVVDDIWRYTGGTWIHVIDPTTCGLNNAIEAANTNTTVGGCAAGSTGTDLIVVTTLQRDIQATITSPIRILGGAHEIHGYGRAFTVSGDDGALTIEDAILTGGRLGGQDPQGEDGGTARGGAIYAGPGTSVTILRSILKDNRVTASYRGPDDGDFGGVVLCHREPWDGACGRNGAEADGGDALGGAVAGTDADITIVGSIISGNTVAGGDAVSQDGTDGGDGEDGLCLFDDPEHSHIAGMGGDGGDGADATDGGDAIGAAVAIVGGSLTIEQSQISANTLAAGEGAGPGDGGMGGEGGSKGVGCRGGGADGDDGADGTGTASDGRTSGAIAVLGDGEASVTASTITANTGTIASPVGGDGSTVGVFAGGDATLSLNFVTLMRNELTVDVTLAAHPAVSFDGPVSISNSIADDGALVDEDGDLAITNSCGDRDVDDAGGNVLGYGWRSCPTGAGDASRLYADQFAEASTAAPVWQMPGDAEMTVIAPTTDSAAIGRAGTCTDVDQLGQTRPGACDAGAYERGGVSGNTAPWVIGAPDDMAVVAESTHTIDLRQVFTDLETPNGLTYTVEVSQDENVPALRATVSGNTARLVARDLQNSAEVTLTATDDGGLSASTTFAVSVTFSQEQLQDSVLANDEYTIPAVARGFWIGDPEGLYSNDRHMYGSGAADIIDPPAHGDVEFNRMWGGFSYAPRDGYTGDDSFTYGYAFDCGDLVCVKWALVTLHVVAPTAVDDEFTGLVAGRLFDSGDASVLDNDEGSGIDGEQLTARLTVQTTQGTVTMRPNGTFTFQPNDGFTGRTRIFYVTENQFDAVSARASLWLTVAEDTPPTVVDESYEVYPGATLIAPESVLANDSDAEGDALTVTEWGQPEHGTLVGSADGSFQYTAPQDGFTGLDTVEYTVEAAGLTATGTVTITVKAAPMPQPDEYSVPAAEGTLDVDAAAGVLANDDAPVGFGAIVQAPAAYGDLELLEDGSFTYTPQPDFHGIDEFGYRIEGTDGGRGGETTVLVRVPRAENTAPLAVADSYTTEQGVALELQSDDGVLANDSDPDGDVLRVVDFDATSAQGGGVQIGAAGELQYLPPMKFSGTDTFEYLVADGNVSITGTVTVTVKAPADDDQPADDDSGDGGADDGATGGDTGGSDDGGDAGGSDGGSESSGPDSGGPDSSGTDGGSTDGGSGDQDDGPTAGAERGSVPDGSRVTTDAGAGGPDVDPVGPEVTDGPSQTPTPDDPSPTEAATTDDEASQAPSSAQDDTPTAGAGEADEAADDSESGSFPGAALAIGLGVVLLGLMLLLLLARRGRDR